MNIPQIMPITTLQRNYVEVVKNLPAGPVFLSQRSRPVAVMLSSADYEKLVRDAEEGQRLKRIAQYTQDFADMRNGKYTEG